MMKKNAIIIALGAIALLACQKENANQDQAVTPVEGPMSFVVSLPETRTELADHSVLWVEYDEIRVFGYTDSGHTGSAVFAFTRTNDDGTALFTIKEGESFEKYDNYYAAYPAISEVTLSVSSGVASMTFPRLNSFPYNVRNQRPTAGQFDPKLAVMTAKYDGERLIFRHGVGYVKITVPYDDVTSIDINFANNCLGDTPVYNLETGTLSSLSSSSNHITASTSFVKGQTYYLAAIPRAGYSIGTTTVAYTITGENTAVSVSTDHFSGKNVAIGKIFDLGAPAKVLSPKITYTAPAKLAYDAESGSFAYNVVNASDQNISAALTSGSWIDASSVSVDAAEGTVSFTCSKNDAADAQERSAVITLSYSGAESVEVTVTQGIRSSANHVRIYYNGTEELLDGTNNIGTAFFSHSTSYVNLSSSASNGGGIDSYKIPETTINVTKSLKLDGNGWCRFTTGNSMDSSVTFYYTKRSSGTGKIQITPAEGDAIVYTDVQYGIVNSKTIALEGNTEYTIARNSGELLLVAVVVNETAN